MNKCKSEDMGSGAWKSEPSIVASRPGNDDPGGTLGRTVPGFPSIKLNQCRGLCVKVRPGPGGSGWSAAMVVSRSCAGTG